MPRRTDRPDHRPESLIEPNSIALFLAVVALGSYVQTVTGFALGLIVVGSTALLQLAPLPSVAIAISLLGLGNTLGALHRRFAAVDWRIVVATSLGTLPAIAVGLWLLSVLHDQTPAQLRRLLGLFILVSGVLMMVRPATLARPSAGWGYTIAGLIGGLFGGLFSAPGPPIVLFLYLQPLAVRTIQVTLLGIFLVTALSRTSLVLLQGQIGGRELLLVLLSFPVVLLFTWIGRRFPPPLDDRNMRRAAFGLLVLIGCSLAVG